MRDEPPQWQLLDGRPRSWVERHLHFDSHGQLGLLWHVEVVQAWNAWTCRSNDVSLDSKRTCGTACCTADSSLNAGLEQRPAILAQ